MEEGRRRSTGSRRRPERVEGRRRRELLKFYGIILGMVAAIWVVWGISYVWFELHQEEEPAPASLVEAAEKALSRGNAVEARKEAELARLLIGSRREHAEGEEKADLLGLAQRLSAIEAQLPAGAASPE